MKKEESPNELPILSEKLISIEMDEVNKSKLVTTPSSEIELDYVEFGEEPEIKIKGLILIVIPGLLIGAKVFVAKQAGIPILEYLFVSLLIAFILNYYLVRKYNLYPYLPNDGYDQQLKFMSFLGLVAIVSSALFGWNNSGAIVVALLWQIMRGNRIGTLAYGFIAAIAGSLMLQDNYNWNKLLQFIPGILLGYISSTLYTLRESSSYTILHEFLLIVTVFLPISFPMQQIVKPTIIQWVVMIVGGLVALPTGHLIIKMMQLQRVSIGMVVFCSILMLITTQYLSFVDYFGGIIIILGVLWIINKVYFSGDQGEIV